MFYNSITNFLSSQLFANLLLLITVAVALFFGYRQVWLNDVVEIYATPDTKQVLDSKALTSYTVPIVGLRNVGTRLVYLDKYVFNGSEYKTYGQVLPSTYSQASGLYWIDLPSNGQTTHVSIVLYFHDLDQRKWKSEIVADFTDHTWKVSSLPRSEDK